MDNLVGWVYGIIDVQIDRRRRRRIVCEPRKNDLLDVAFDMEGEVESEGWVMNQDTMRGMFMVILILSHCDSIFTGFQFHFINTVFFSLDSQFCKILQ
jgi:hypothetical protein